RCLFLICLVFPILLSAQEVEDPFAVVAPVQTQLDAYNTGDIELFLSAYSDTVKIYNFPDEPRFTGKEEMRQRYGPMFERLPDLQCRLVSRTVMKDKVIDHESVVWDKKDPTTEVIAIYRVADGLIQEVWFLR
ncbi:MAG: nuclear transport factor 2 family protein, partial [Bacteroidota bacterium]